MAVLMGYVGAIGMCTRSAALFSKHSGRGIVNYDGVTASRTRFCAADAHWRARGPGCVHNVAERQGRRVRCRLGRWPRCFPCRRAVDGCSRLRPRFHGPATGGRADVQEQRRREVRNIQWWRTCRVSCTVSDADHHAWQRDISQVDIGGPLWYWASPAGSASVLTSSADVVFYQSLRQSPTQSLCQPCVVVFLSPKLPHAEYTLHSDGHHHLSQSSTCLVTQP